MVYTEGKVENKTYFKLRPSDAVPLRLYQALEVQKPGKSYQIRTIVSTIGTMLYGRYKYLMDIITNLNKN